MTNGAGLVITLSRSGRASHDPTKGSAGEAAGDRSGISSVEHALLLAFVAAGILAAASTLSDAVIDEFLAAAMCIDSFDPNCTF